ncbi:AraC family transcriptional regulator ligand-binding domain-containing protein [Rhizobium sp. BK661]|uniref:AraC family transcriptional regulator ligand-binding domain-containing protein n=1 Tax=unclassified Rhizobium TaxID=2613769 RepID=UPI001FEDAD22
MRPAVSFERFSRHTDRHHAEFVASVLLRVCRKLMGSRIIPLSVSLAHHCSGDLAQIKSLFGCDVQFGDYSDGLTFDAAVLGLPVIGIDPFLTELLSDFASKPSPRVCRPWTLVENTISPLLPHGEASADNVAHRLGVSERTFARRLAAQGTAFGLILDGLRHELTITCMQDGLQASRIAWLLGFHQSSSFTHACKR